MLRLEPKILPKHEILPFRHSFSMLFKPVYLFHPLVWSDGFKAFNVSFLITFLVAQLSIIASWYVFAICIVSVICPDEKFNGFSFGGLSAHLVPAPTASGRSQRRFPVLFKSNL